MEAQRRANLAEIAKILQGTRPIDVGVLYSFAHTEQSVVQRGLGLYSLAFHCWVSSNEHLENKVEEKTVDIHSILTNIPYGILTITPDQSIHSEYSKFFR